MATFEGGLSGEYLKVSWNSKKIAVTITLLNHIRPFKLSIVFRSGFEKKKPETIKPKTIVTLVALTNAEASPYSLAGNHLLIIKFCDCQNIEALRL